MGRVVDYAQGFRQKRWERILKRNSTLLDKVEEEIELHKSQGDRFALLICLKEAHVRANKAAKMSGKLGHNKGSIDALSARAKMHEDELKDLNEKTWDGLRLRRD